MADRSRRAAQILSLCTGGGGLDRAVELAVPGARVVCGVEREAFAVAVLADAMAKGLVAAFPVWSDLRTFDGRRWRGLVDWLTAGYPCQPFSVAGRRLGKKDPRHLWPHVRRVIGECEPEFAFLENVAGHLRLGAREVVRDLHRLGYRVAARLVTAEEVGASHRRERLFILAHRSVRGRRELREPSGRDRLIDGRVPRVADARGGQLPRPERRPQERDGSGPAGPPLVDAERADTRPGDAGVQGGQEVRGRRSPDAGGSVADARGAGREGRERRRSRGPGAGRREAGTPGPASQLRRPLFPPGPDDVERWAAFFAERRRGPHDPYSPSLEPALCGMADGVAAHRRDWLRLLGNGVVDLQGAHALGALLADVREDL